MAAGMTTRIAPAFVVFVCSLTAAWAQTGAPNVSRVQRERLSALVAAVDAAGAQPETDTASMRTHVMRASDGSHYVAFTIDPAPTMPVPERAVVYVRLATAGGRTERSPIRDWLTNSQQPAPPIVATRGIALGEMPIMGATGSLERRPPQTPEMANLAMLDLERRRARERDAERERQRRAELEGRASAPTEVLPFEDFDVAPSLSGRKIQRALTAGPGDFFLYVAWGDSEAPQSPITIVKKRLTLPPASATELAVGSLILADGIQPRDKPLPPQQQASHPYTIGPTEIVPAADAAYRDNENLSVVFQIINPAPGDGGKPNVDVAFHIVRIEGSREQAAAALTPQNYSAANLPPDFDLRSGHPLFGTVTAPLSTLKRGPYRLKMLVTDKTAGRTVTADVDFSVTATAAALLREAPPLGAPFQRDSIFAADVMSVVLPTLRPANPSAALQRAFDLASSGKFVDLLVEETVPEAEEGTRAALRGLAQLSAGDDSAAVQFQRAQLLGAPVAITRFLSGAARAFQSRDADAIAAWQEALKAGAPSALVTPHLVDAYLRRNDAQRASALLGAMTTTGWSRTAAALLIASNRDADAVPLIQARLAQAPDDMDAQWLLLHSLFARLVREPNATAVRDRFRAQAQSYIEAKGAHAALAAEWLAAISSS